MSSLYHEGVYACPQAAESYYPSVLLLMLNLLIIIPLSFFAPTLLPHTLSPPFLFPPPLFAALIYVAVYGEPDTGLPDFLVFDNGPAYALYGLAAVGHVWPQRAIHAPLRPKVVRTMALPRCPVDPSSLSCILIHH